MLPTGRVDSYCPEQPLGMSGPQLAKRFGVTKARISKAEHDELSGSVTLKSMQAMAEAMGCRFVYAVIPELEVEEVIKKRAFRKGTGSSQGQLRSIWRWRRNH